MRSRCKSEDCCSCVRGCGLARRVLQQDVRRDNKEEEKSRGGTWLFVYVYVCVYVVERQWN